MSLPCWNSSRCVFCGKPPAKKKSYAVLKHNAARARIVHFHLNCLRAHMKDGGYKILAGVMR